MAAREKSKISTYFNKVLNKYDSVRGKIYVL